MPDRTEDSRMTKLPKWAQAEIRRLTAGLKYTNEIVMAMGEKDGDVVINAFSEEAFSMPARTYIRFTVEGGRISVGIRDGGVLDINADGGTLIILPRAANSAYVKVER